MPESPTATQPSATGLASLPAQGKAAIRGGVLGNYVDQINIFLPVTALAPALTTIAGPGAVASSTAFVVMATLIGRPLGAMIFGRIADRAGRARTTKLAITGTAACTLLIACTPTYHYVGAFAMAMIIALRFLGGIFLAGEYSAAIPLAMEWSKPRRRGLWSGMIMSMAPWAQGTIAFVTTTLLVTLGPAAYADWGWRASFAAGGLASVGMLIYYSRRVADAPIPHRAPVAAKRVGLREVVVGRYRKQFWQMFGLMSGLWFQTNMVVIVLTSRLVSDVHLSPGDAALAMGIASVGQAVVMAVTGHLSTHLGRRRFFLIWGAMGLIAGPSLWFVIMGQHSLAPVAISAVLIQVLTVTAYGPIGAYLTERFPAEVRSTGYGTAYSLSIVIPALYPYYLPALESLLGRAIAPAALLILGGLLITVCAAVGPALRPAEIDDDVETVAARQKVAA